MKRTRFILVIALLIAAGPQATRAQGCPSSWPCVLDEGMLSRNAQQTVHQGMERWIEAEKLDAWLDLLQKLPAYDWRDLDGALQGLDILMADLEALGYSRVDLLDAFASAFPGYNDVTDRAAQHRERGEQVLGTYRAALESLQQHADRYEDALDRLAAYKRRLLVAAQQGSLEIQAQARILSAEEALLLREMLMTQSLLRTLSLSEQANDHAFEAATLRRSLGLE